MSKHPDPDNQPVNPPDDLERNPGIGQSSGLNRREGLAPLEGDNTVEGDVKNDSGLGGGANPDQRGRDNR
ncbi:MAG: hypothetical protein Q7V15_14320 [Phenylobacterium sp.]|uniref:hypothetical protein n=1 Tax=Phenylobacterium sp. TaxID=1871053 RepID=UPI00271A731C|nr:hypothetical protein [Phenylobacterium sp.]MDO8902519.1 hypothetical protein [Phenylobacterium sp.]